MTTERRSRASVQVHTVDISASMNLAEKSCGIGTLRLGPMSSEAIAEEPLTQTLNFETLNYQAAGHADTLFKGDGEFSRMILKRRDEQELVNYEEIFNKQDAIQDFVPRYYGCINGDFTQDDTDGGKSEPFMLLENLLVDYNKPLVADCKLGIRSFEEKEAKSKKGRKDLYERLMKIGAEHVTEEEKAAESVTKYKWMRTRDKMSSLHSLGFRIDGIVGPNGINVHADKFANISERADVVREIRRYLEYLPIEEGPPFEAPRQQVEQLELRAKLASELADKLTIQRDNCIKSEFVSRHEFIGASLLIVTEASPPQVGVHLIDLAKTSMVPDGIKVDHRSAWEPGNHEDGILFGLDNCISCVLEVLSQFQKEREASEAPVLKDQEAAERNKCYCCQS